MKFPCVVSMGTYRPSPYEGLQTLFAEGKHLSDKERLTFSYGPLLSWYRENRRALPWRENKDAYRIWISEIMLQQTRVEAVKPYFFRFMEHFPTVEALANAPDEELLKCWEGLGYYSRARNLKKAAIVIMEEHGGKLPASREELLALPGIGSYTAGAIGSIAYEIPAPAVDGNVLRVLSRVMGSYDDILTQSTKKKMEDLVSQILRSGEAGDYNQALIEIGAIVCVPNGAPLCDKCPFHTVCAAREQGLIDELPVKTPKKKRRIEEKTVLLLRCGEKIAIRKRGPQGLLASLYEFVNVPGNLEREDVESMLNGTVSDVEVPDAKHIFSHVEWHMNGYLVQVDQVSNLQLDGDEPVIFVTYEELKEKYPIPAAFVAYKRFLDQIYMENMEEN